MGGENTEIGSPVVTLVIVGAVAACHRSGKWPRTMALVDVGLGHGRRRRGPADTATTRPVNPQVRTRPGAPANFRLCATDIASFVIGR